MEREGVTSLGNDINRQVLKVGEARLECRHSLSIPDNVNESWCFFVWRAEGAGLEEANLVGLASFSCERASISECTRESINARGRSEEGDSIAVMSKWLEEEDSGIKGSS